MAIGEKKIHCEAVRYSLFKCWPTKALIILLSMEGRCGKDTEKQNALTKKKEIH